MSDAQAGAPAPDISIVIPALNEATRLPRLLAELRAADAGAEVIVVDGGSADGTAAVARAAGAHVIVSPPGRGQQLAAGAAAAQGDVLWFLHADSRVPVRAITKIRDTLTAAPDTMGGNFRLLFDGGDDFSRWLDGFYAWIRRRGVYYGDSAVFVRRAAYHALGGIRPIALMEDYDFNRRLERYGPTCCIENPPLVTSSRRFRGRRPVRIVLGWLAIHVLFHLGVSPELLARLYNSDRRRRPAAQRPATAVHEPAAPLSDQS